MKKEQGEVVDPELGRLVTTRRRVDINLVGILLFGPLGLFLVAGGIIHIITNLTNGKGHIGIAFAMLAISLVPLGVTWVAVQGMRTKLWYYELGAAKTIGKERKTVIRYAETSEFVLQLVRQFVNGVYAGTAATIKLRTPDKRSIAFSGKYKEKSKGFFKRQFESRDELETVRELISEQMADGMMERMLKGEPVEWSGRATLTPTGFVPRAGKLKGQAIAYAQIDRYTMKAGALYLYQPGVKKSFLSVPANAKNFWPGFVVFMRMAQMHLNWNEVDSTQPDAGAAEAEAAETA